MHTDEERRPTIPAAYRSLLLLHPPRFREQDGEVVLSTLLEVHAAQRRTAPSLAERLRFAVDGLSMRLRRPSRTRLPATRWSVPLSAMDHFDQANGAVAERFVDATEQFHANVGRFSADGERRIAERGWIGMS
ncbi:hypothetical protein [uncultured Amnibacterium sp.]|uniref:hypothetical protein n=1 Tax=uncultured Amnibacterium sp. TaxID=1631851 RepID=UPI0035CBDC94